MKLADQILEVADKLEPARRGAATAGTMTSLTDSLAAFPVDWWKGGVIWILSGALAGKTFEVSTNSATVITFGNASGSVSAGDQYAVCRAHYNRAALVGAVNQALHDIGDIPLLDTSLLAVSGQTEYTLPAGLRSVTRVETTSSSAAPYTWAISYRWKVVGDQLIFDTGAGPTLAGSPIRLTYLAQHPVISADSDQISPSIHPERITWAAAYQAAVQRQLIAANDERLKEYIKLLQGEKERSMIRFPVRITNITSHMSGY